MEGTFGTGDAGDASSTDKRVALIPTTYPASSLSLPGSQSFSHLRKFLLTQKVCALGGPQLGLQLSGPRALPFQRVPGQWHLPPRASREGYHGKHNDKNNTNKIRNRRSKAPADSMLALLFSSTARPQRTAHA